MLIPWQMLEAETLQALIEDFVTRDGTDNGDDSELQTRVARARKALERKEAVILFDSDSGQCMLMARHQVPPELLAGLDE